MQLLAWGDPHAEPVVCVHGLSRNAHDFDILAAQLAKRFYVLCPTCLAEAAPTGCPTPRYTSP